MAQIQFFETKKSLDVFDKKGEKLNTYYVDVGNVDMLKSILVKVRELQKNYSALQGAEISEEFIDTVVGQQRDIVTLLIGDYDILWEYCEHNVMMMQLIVEELVRLVNEALTDYNERRR